MASKCFPGLHAVTGCDTVSAFSGKGKVKNLKLVLQNESYQETLAELGLAKAVIYLPILHFEFSLIVVYLFMTRYGILYIVFFRGVKKFFIQIIIPKIFFFVFFWVVIFNVCCRWDVTKG